MAGALQGAAVPQAQPFPELIDFLPGDLNSAQKLPLLQVFCPLQAQGVWGHLAGWECSSQLPSASGSSFLYNTWGCLGLVPSAARVLCLMWKDAF